MIMPARYGSAGSIELGNGPNGIKSTSQFFTMLSLAGLTQLDPAARISAHSRINPCRGRSGADRLSSTERSAEGLAG
ncbi:hypothetical protein ACFSC1_04425 [Paracoccus aurantiacus]|uniref:hypothetical protein n=1 Tax=Paracoccus aurantiacus TaxID=2599412 RepID=UPI00362F5D0C